MIGSFAGITAVNFLVNVNDDNLQLYKNLYLRINNNRNVEALSYIELEFRKIKEILDSIESIIGVSVKTKGSSMNTKFTKESLSIFLVKLLYAKKDYIEKLFTEIKDLDTVDSSIYPFINSTNYTVNSLLQAGYSSFRRNLEYNTNKFYNTIKDSRSSGTASMSMTEYLNIARNSINSYGDSVSDTSALSVKDMVLRTEETSDTLEDQKEKYGIVVPKLDLTQTGSNVKIEASVALNKGLGLAGYHYNLEEMHERSKDILNLDDNFNASKVIQTFPSAIKLLDILIDSTEGVGEKL